ncbi:hypothetical protein ACOJBO_23160 [Rhizobium beringeri]
MKRISILFVCMGNICRSPLAEGIFWTSRRRGRVDRRFYDRSRRHRRLA